MNPAIKTPAPAATGREGHADNRRLTEDLTNSHDITAATIAHALNAKKTGDRWMACCVAHDDKRPSMSIAEGRHGPLVHCFAGCSQTDLIEALRARGLWSGATPAARQRVVSKRKVDEIWCATLRDLVAGRPAVRVPPYRRTLPANGEVQIVAGVGAWDAAKMLAESGGHALVAPPGIPSIAYHWPVYGRRVLLLQLDSGDDATNAAESLGRLQVARWGAVQVRVFADGDPLTLRPELPHAH